MQLTEQEQALADLVSTRTLVASRKGTSKPIPFVGHVVPKRNPALNAWAAGVACHKDWRPQPGCGKLTRKELIAACNSLRTDHPGRKS